MDVLLGLAELSEAHSRALMDSVITAAHATSFTRFETDHRDFDRRLADCIQVPSLPPPSLPPSSPSLPHSGVPYQSSNLSRSGYMIHGPALNPWTLCLASSEIESAYQEHFLRQADGTSPSSSSSPAKSERGGDGLEAGFDAPTWCSIFSLEFNLELSKRARGK